MGLPSKKRTNTSKRQRASHFALKPTTLTKCKQCDSLTLPHRACAKCGYYGSKKAIDTKKRMDRRLKKLKQTK